MPIRRKLCRTCGTEKPISHFHRRTASQDGRQATCIDCTKANRPRYRESQRRSNRDYMRRQRRRKAKH